MGVLVLMKILPELLLLLPDIEKQQVHLLCLFTYDAFLWARNTGNAYCLRFLFLSFPQNVLLIIPSDNVILLCI